MAQIRTEERTYGSGSTGGAFELGRRVVEIESACHEAEIDAVLCPGAG
ncbi:hypothetical protein ACWCXH_34745 [Kitasatospora sp. NPDC001660]